MKKFLPVIPHLLLIDDDEDEIKILSDALADAGISCQCTWAIGPLHGIGILKYFTPQVIFMDYRMPQMTGIECIRTIREIPGIEEIPIILYSSEIDQALADQALDAGAIGFIKKTGSISKLSAELKTLFSQKVVAEQLENLNSL